MDTLITYILVRLTIKILVVEFLIMVLCCIAIILIKAGSHWLADKKKAKQDKLSILIETTLFSKDPLDNFIIPSDLMNFQHAVEVLEKFDQRFTDQRWIDIKNRVVHQVLLNSIDKYANNRSWFKRQLAARALLLNPANAKEDILRKLLNDSSYLVRIVAAVCITKTPFENLFGEMIVRMSKETELSQFSYRDALMQCDHKKFKWIEYILETNTDPAVSAICLDLLSTRYTDNLLPLISPFLRSENQKCRILAIKAVGNIPNSDAIRILNEHLTDSDWEIRAESVVGLSKLHAVQSSTKLQIMLNDPIWWVRLQAALALKSFGIEGKMILANQNKDLVPLAYEIAQYTLALPG